MSKFEVTSNTQHPFFKKLKIKSKSVPLENSSVYPERIKANSKWEIEKQLMKDIALSKRLNNENQNSGELRFVLHCIANQISSTETKVSYRTAEVLLGILVDRISSSLSQAQRTEQLAEHQDQELFYSGTYLKMDEFSCQSCCELLHNPITLSCGHSFCQACIVQSNMKACIVCSKQLPKDVSNDYRINNILSKILQKYHPKEWLGRACVTEGLIKFNNEEYKEALQKFSEALSIIPNSHIATLYRAKTYYLLNQLDQALEDSIRASLLAHKWPEAYFVKGEILFKLHCFEESLLSLLICVVLDPHNVPVKDRIHEIVTKLVESANEDVKAKRNKALPGPPSSSKLSPATSKRLLSDSDGNLLMKRKFSKKDSDDCTDVKATVISVYGFSSTPQPSKTEAADVDSSLVKVKKKTGAMASCNTRVLLTFELSYDKGHNEILFGESLGMFPSVASELESTLDTALFEIDNSVTRDLRMLQNSTFDKELLELVNIKLPRKPRVIDPKLIDASEFECSLCMRLFHDPVCTPCGHMFCQLCIERCLDHSPMCPLCKHPMQKYLAETLEKRHPTCDYVSKAIIQQYLPDSYKERLKQHQDEMNELLACEPIFVCTIAFPSVLCPLHIFEPRYRLMLRRCLDHNEREFGMCMPDKDKTHHEIGTLLKVRDVTFFSDGRSVVDSIGSKRFKTSNCHIKDGYNVAKITYIVDKPITDVEMINKLCEKVYMEAQIWFVQLEGTVKERILKHFGAFPVRDQNINTENGPNWVWWVLAVLPVEDRVKASVLGKDTLQERLLIVHRIFTCLKQRKKQ